MPKIYRVMEEDEGKPQIGTGPAMLGARLPGSGATHDIAPDENGNVQPGTGGLSVAPRLQDLPVFLIPRRLKHLVEDAAGTNRRRVWSMGSGEFEDGPVARDLRLSLDGKDEKHGLVEPDRIMPVDQYQSALASTQSLWAVDET
jgi:hypothetical protein